MVCKDELCTWFRSLSPHTRIDYMCGLLLMCHPLELRFIGSAVEDLGKKDFHCLREFEGKSNSHHELTKLNCANDNCLRETMALNLALLHSSNTTCANVIFNLVESNLERAFTVTDDLHIDTVRYILLVFTMAMYHPAFSHYQRTRMYECFQKAEKNSAELLIKTNSKGGSDERMSFRHEDNASQTETPQPSNDPPASLKLHKAFVNSIELKGTTKRDQRSKKLEVIWSNGDITEVNKTYKELQDFVSRLKKIFPDEDNLPSPEGSSLTHDSVRSGCRGNKMDTELGELIRSIHRYLPKLPQHMKACENLNEFFCSGEPSSPMSTTQPNSNCLSLDDETVISYSPARSITVYNSQLPHSHAGTPHTKTVSSLPPVTVTAPTHRHSCPVRNSPPQMSCSCLIPSVSPVGSRASSPNIQGADPTLGPQKQPRPIRLENNVPYSPELTPLSREDGERPGVVKLPAGLEQITREKSMNLQNGIVHDGMMPPAALAVPWQTVSTHPTYHPSVRNNQPLIYPIPYNYQYQHTPIAYTNNEVVRDSPSTGSDSSSHSPSPVSYTKHQPPQITSSSEELDKDHLYTSENGKIGENKKKGSQWRGNNHQSKTSLHTLEEKSQSCANTKSGYTSDPTPTGFAIRPPGMKFHCKVQPQTKLFEDGHNRMKVPVGYAHPMPAMITTAMTQSLTNSNTSMSHSSPSSESLHRPVLYNMMPSPCVRSQSPTMNGTGRIPNCSVTTATQVIVSSGTSHFNQNPVTSKSVHSMSSAASTSDCGSVDQSVQASPVTRNGSPASVGVPNTHGTVQCVPHSPGGPGNVATSHCSHCGNHANTEHSYPNMLSAQFSNLFLAPNAVISPGSNGLIPTPMPHNVQYRYTYPPHFPNGMNTEFLYANQTPNYRIFQPGQTPMPFTGFIYGCNPYNQTYQNSHSNMSKSKKLYCHNCGSSKHHAGECSENSMDSMSGNYNINYKPDTD